MSEIAQRRTEQFRQLISWMLPRLSSDREVAFDMLAAYMHQAHDDGLSDAQKLIADLHEQTQIHSLRVARDAIAQLRRMNEVDRT